MNLLLDTCALLALSNGTLSTGAAKTLRTAPEACVSSVSSWEVALKAAAGKLSLAQQPGLWFEALLDHHQACSAAELPAIHKDPFDRVLVALAHAHSLCLITNDRFIVQYPNLNTLW